MLRTVDRYVAWTVTVTVVVVLVCFVTLTASFALVEEVREEEAAYGFRDAFAYVLHTLPRRVHELVPFVIFLGVLIGLGVLAGNSEVTVLRAAGMSLRRLYAPVGAVVVHDGRLLARRHNERELTSDPVAHAEILAITKAANKIKDWRLSDCTLYVTKEPCPMCAGAAIMARIYRLVYAVPDPKMGFLGGALDITKTQSLNHHPQIARGVLEGDCKLLLSSFFEQKRMVAKEGS